MDVFDAVRTVLAVRAYQDKPIPENVLHRIVEAAHLTASSRNAQPWHFIVVQDKTNLRHLGELAQTGRYTGDAAAAVAVAVERDSPYGLSDAGRAIQSMVLTAWAEGIGSNWVGFEGTLDHIAPELGVTSDLRLVAIVPFGYPVNRVGRGKKSRKPFREVVHSEKFGTPFS